MRLRTGTLLAAHALVASFLGATTVRAQGLNALGWVALIGLVSGLVVAAVLLAPWHMRFALNATEVYRELYEQASRETETNAVGCLVAAGFGYERLRAANASKVRLMSMLSGALGVLMVMQTLAWLADLAIQ